MFDKFGEFNSAGEINELASNLKKEGDLESVRMLAEENGIGPEIADAFVSGEIPFLCDAMSAAVGKLDIEAGELGPMEIMEDWLQYIKARCFEEEAMAVAVRAKGKTLKGCIGGLLAWGFKHQEPVDREIIKASGVKAGKVTLGIPGMGRAKKLITKYYLGGKEGK